MPAACFTSDEVRATVERALSVIAKVASQGGRVLRLDGLAITAQRPSCVEIWPSPGEYTKRRFTAKLGGKILGRFRTVAAALLAYPAAKLSPAVENMMKIGGKK